MKHLEERAEILCSLSWPARRPEVTGSFERSVGWAMRGEGSTMHHLPNCPLRILRDADAFEEFYRKPLAEARTRVQEPWALHIKLVIQDNFHRNLLPFTWPNAQLPGFSPDQLPDLDVNTYVRPLADCMWLSLQFFYVSSVKILEQTGMTLYAIHELYMWLWGTKEGPGPDHDVSNRLRTGYAQLARSTLQKGDDKMATEYGKVALDSSPTKEIAEELWIEFAQMKARWDEFADAKENVVKRVATVAREGFAEWSSVIQARLVHDGLISPITNELKEFHSSGQGEARRQYILGMSATNPYRRGLELMEAIETELGLWPAMMAGFITEYPLEALRLRVPSSSFEQVERGSLWAPDTRLEKLAELSTRHLPFTPAVMQLLYTIYLHLDDTLPGIMTYAFDQFARHSKEEQLG